MKRKARPKGTPKKNKRMKTKFKTNYNVEEFPPLFPDLDPKSETVPGMSMSILEIIRRCASGTNPAIERPIFYDGNSEDLNYDMVDPTSRPDFDLLDADEIEREIENRKIVQLVVNQPVAEPTETVVE